MLRLLGIRCYSITYDFTFPYSRCYRCCWIVLITGPTVIQPLLKQAKVRKNVDSILRWESIILDPIGPILALSAFYIYQIIDEGFGLHVILIFGCQIIGTIAIGFGASFLFNWLIKLDFISQGLMPSIQLVFILLVLVYVTKYYLNQVCWLLLFLV